MNRIVRIAEERKEFAVGEDGFVYWWPKGKGAIGASELRALANELDSRNAEWERQIDDYFALEETE